MVWFYCCIFCKQYGKINTSVSDLFSPKDISIFTKYLLCLELNTPFVEDAIFKYYCLDVNILEVEKLSKRRSVGLELRTLSLLMRRQLDQTTCTTLPEKDNLTAMHGWTISYLYKNQDKDVFQKDFERAFSIRKSTASRVLKSMESNGLITRHSVPYDTRLKKIVLTEEALRIHDGIESRRAILEQKLLTGIPEEKIEVFFEVMDAMKENIES